jgi:electron transport complex protein RnfE
MHALSEEPGTQVFRAGVLERNPAWGQLLGLCPLLAVSGTVVNALGLALASLLVLVGSSTCIALSRRIIPDFARLPAFVLIIATFTTIAVLLMQAYAFDLYLRIALFVQIIVTNCMILARAESFASHNAPRLAIVDALGTGCGFAIALVALGATRELLATGGVFDGMELLLGPGAERWHLAVANEPVGLRLAAMPAGAFIVAGLLLALAQHLIVRRAARRSAP